MFAGPMFWHLNVIGARWQWNNNQLKQTFFYIQAIYDFYGSVLCLKSQIVVIANHEIISIFNSGLYYG